MHLYGKFTAVYDAELRQSESKISNAIPDDICYIDSGGRP